MLMCVYVPSRCIVSGRFDCLRIRCQTAFSIWVPCLTALLLVLQFQQALERVRAGADVMPQGQLQKVISAELGPDWRTKMASFEDEPLAAASIGQVGQLLVALALVPGGTNTVTLAMHAEVVTLHLSFCLMFVIAASQVHPGSIQHQGMLQDHCTPRCLVLPYAVCCQTPQLTVLCEGRSSMRSWPSWAKKALLPSATDDSTAFSESFCKFALLIPW